MCVFEGFIIFKVLGVEKKTNAYVNAHLDGYIAGLWLAAIVYI
jgi:hypothetical protein